MKCDSNSSKIAKQLESNAEKLRDSNAAKELSVINKEANA